MQFEFRNTRFDIKGHAPGDHIYQCISRSGTFYEIDLLEYIHRLHPFFRSKKNENIIIDVGANIGNHSIYFGAFLADHLIAIEPNPEILPTLRRNLSKNLKNYTLYEHAVSEKDGKGAITLPQGMGNNIGAAKINLNDEKGDVEISTLDSTLSSWRHGRDASMVVSLIKIDVEGMELQVLKGGEQTILEHKPHIFAEAASEKELVEIYGYLRSLGYKKLPGRWAATPVYHFAHRPTLSLLAAAYYHTTLKEFATQLKRRLVGGLQT